MDWDLPGLIDDDTDDARAAARRFAREVHANASLLESVALLVGSSLIVLFRWTAIAASGAARYLRSTVLRRRVTELGADRRAGAETARRAASLFRS